MNSKLLKLCVYPHQEIKLPKGKAEMILDFIEILDDDDIQNVYYNLDSTSWDK